MTGKATPANRAAYEARAESNGCGRVTMRLSPGANRMLKAICEQYQCVPRDVFEGLLLGNITPITERPHGLSASEIAFASAHGIDISS